MALAGKNGNLTEESEADQQVFFSDPFFVHFIGMINPPRPGVADTIQMLEFYYYKPGTSRNDLLSVRVVEWKEITWAIVSIPINEKSLMERVTLPNGIRIANGIPQMITERGTISFPINSPNVFTLENVPGHPVYKK